MMNVDDIDGFVGTTEPSKCSNQERKITCYIHLYSYLVDQFNSILISYHAMLQSHRLYCTSLSTNYLFPLPPILYNHPT